MTKVLTQMMTERTQKVESYVYQILMWVLLFFGRVLNRMLFCIEQRYVLCFICEIIQTRNLIFASLAS